jgi:hypothetical protein
MIGKEIQRRFHVPVSSIERGIAKNEEKPAIAPWKFDIIE